MEAAFPDEATSTPDGLQIANDVPTPETPDALPGDSTGEPLGTKWKPPIYTVTRNVPITKEGVASMGNNTDEEDIDDLTEKLRRVTSTDYQVLLNKITQGGQSADKHLLPKTLLRQNNPGLSEAELEELLYKSTMKLSLYTKDDEDLYEKDCRRVVRVGFDVPAGTTIGDILGMPPRPGDEKDKSEHADVSLRVEPVYTDAFSKEEDHVPGSGVPSYTPLSPDDREIRLLHFAGATKEGGLSLSMRHYRLADAPPFRAVSYCWGDATDTVRATCNGEPVAITRSLDRALKRILSWKVDLPLWADGICINQGDRQERASQVKLMGDIYTTAQATVAYLGEPIYKDEGDETDVELDHQAFALAQHVSAIWRDSPEDDLHPRSGTEWADLQIPDASTEQGLIWWLPLLHLCSQPWYSRSWVLQEVVLAKQVYLFYGAAVNNLESLTRFWDLASRRDPPPALRLGPVAAWMDGVKNWNQLGFFGEIRKAREQEQLQDKGEATEPYYQPGDSGFVLHRRQRFINSLLRLLIKNRAADATDNRDKVYCLLALANDAERLGIEPNYSPENTAARLYQDIAEKYINEGLCFQVLHHAGLPQRLEGLPSWVPNWSTKFRQPFDTSLYYCTKTAAPSPRLLHDGTLRLRGAFVDGAWILGHKVRYQHAEPWRTMDSIKDRESWFLEDDPYTPRLPALIDWSDRNRVLGAIVPNAEMTSLGLLYGTASQEEICEAVWKTLIANKGWMSNDAESERFAYEAWRKTRPDPFDNEWWPPTSMDVADMDAIWPLQERVLHAMQGYRFGITVCGDMGLFPKECEMGDLIAIFPGARTPFVVRPGRAGSYILVGDCYIHGMMEGQMLKPSRDGEVQDAGCSTRKYDIVLRPWARISTDMVRGGFRPYFDPDKTTTASLQDINLQ